MIERDTFYFRVFCVTFWVMGVTPFVLQEILPFLDFLIIPLRLIADVVLLIAGLTALEKKSDKILIGLFVLAGIISSVINQVPTMLWINGFRDYIPFLFALPVLRYVVTCKKAELFCRSIDRQLKIFLVIQAFCVTEQFIRYGAGDHGGGSLGDGFSGVISILIILISFYFVQKNWDGENYMRSLWENRLYIFLLFPVFLNETKVSFVFLFVYFVILFPFNIRSVGKSLIAAPVIALTFYGAYAFYMFATDSEYDITDSSFYDDYLTGGVDGDDLVDLADMALEELEAGTDDWLFVDLPRGIKAGLIFPALEDSRGGSIIGAGLGHFKGGSVLEKTPFYIEHEAFIAGTRLESMLILIPLGIIGLIWYIFWIRYSLMMSIRSSKHALLLKILLLSVFVVTFFYNDFYSFIFPCIVFYYLCVRSIYNPSEEQPAVSSVL